MQVVQVKEICSIGNCFILFFIFFFFFFFLWCVFWDQGKEEKVNYADVISERHRKHFIYKTEFYVFFFCLFSFFFFCNWILSFQSQIPTLKTYFYVVVFWSSSLFLTLAFFLSVNVDFVAQSLASGTVEDREKQILSSLIIIALLGKKRKLQWKTLGLKLTIKKTT